jgi:hypothetical protein
MEVQVEWAEQPLDALSDFRLRDRLGSLDRVHHGKSSGHSSSDEYLPIGL